LRLPDWKLLEDLHRGQGGCSSTLFDKINTFNCSTVQTIKLIELNFVNQINSNKKNSLNMSDI
jgi:hypothetical protein